MNEPDRFDSDMRRLKFWGGVLLVVAFVALLVVLRGVLAPLFFAFLIAYVLDPAVDKLETFRLPRAAAIVVLLILLLTGLGLFLVLLVPQLAHEVALFARELPGTFRSALDEWRPVLESRGIELPHSLPEIFDQLSSESEGLGRDALSPVATVLQGLVGRTAGALASAVSTLMVPVFAFYLLYDYDRIIAGISELLPGRYAPSIRSLSSEVDDVLRSFLRGQLIVMCALAALYSIGFSIAGIRLAVPIGILAGLVSFIPYFGGALALILALLMCAFEYQGMGQIGAVLAVYGVVQVLEGFVITPKVVGEQVGLSAIWVLIALLVFGELLGFTGVLLALPAAAVLKIFVSHALRKYRASALYNASPSPVEAPAETTVDTPENLSNIGEVVVIAAASSEAE